MAKSKPVLSVIVGNIGDVHTGTHKRQASDIYRHYCDMSDAGTGRASGQNVTLLRNAEPILEHQGLLSRLAAIDDGSFMQSEIEQGTFWEVEMKDGSSCILPGDLVTLPEIKRTDFGEHLDLFADYIPESCGFSHGSANIRSAEKKEGWGARLSAPGYMDQTDWSLFDTEMEAIAYIVDTYETEHQTDDEDVEGDLDEG